MLGKGRSHLQKGILDYAVGDELVAPEILNEVTIRRTRAAPSHVDSFRDASNLLGVRW